MMRQGFLLRAAGALLVVAHASHLVTSPCGLFEGLYAPSTPRFATLIEYHWQLENASAITESVTNAREHVEAWSQRNHECSAEKLYDLARVDLVVDAVRRCACAFLAPQLAPQCKTVALDPAAGLVNVTRIFVGDSRMSGEARVYAHMLRLHCGPALRLSRDYDGQARRTNFGAYCEELRSSVFFVRVETLNHTTALDVAAPVAQMKFEGAPVPALIETPTEVIFGVFVWNIIGLPGQDVAKFINGSVESALAPFVRSVQNMLPSASLVLRASPPVNPPMGGKIEGLLSKNLPLIRDTYDSWTTQERHFAAKIGIEYLDASTLVHEYQVALDIARGPRPLSALYVDVWHPCVPLVPTTYVRLLPYMALARK